jgi:hypothetical protein
MRREVRDEILVGRLRERRRFLRHELEFLPQPAADDRVVPVKAERDRLPHENFFADVVLDQTVELLAGGRPLPRAAETLRKVADARFADDDLASDGCRRPPPGIQREEQRAQQQEMHQRLAGERSQHRAFRKRTLQNKSPGAAAATGRS